LGRGHVAKMLYGNRYFWGEQNGNAELNLGPKTKSN